MSRSSRGATSSAASASSRTRAAMSECGRRPTSSRESVRRRHFDDRFLRLMRDLPKICRHLHLPVQSGSTRVLDAMRRRYTRESYLDLVARIRATLPEVALSTDMIVGFPGETEDDFEQTLS